jgi:hypothetical protein
MVILINLPSNKNISDLFHLKSLLTNYYHICSFINSFLSFIVSFHVEVGYTLTVTIILLNTNLSPIIAVSDLRALYKGSDVTLTDKNMQGTTQIVGIIISNPDSGNVPKDVVVLQNIRRSATRGITPALGSTSNTYHSGDSLIVNVAGTMLKKVNGAMPVPPHQTQAMHREPDGQLAVAVLINLTSPAVK